MGHGADLASAYGDDSVLFRVLRHMGWDGLANIGYYTGPTLPVAVLTGPALFQHRLARRSLALLGARPGERVLERWPGFRTLTARDWVEVVNIVRAHQSVGPATHYIAYVFDKPD